MIIYYIIREDKHRQHGPIPTNLTQCVYNNDNISGANWWVVETPVYTYI